MAEMDIYIYPDRFVDDPAAQEAQEGLTSSLNEVINSTVIDSYLIEIRDDYPDVCSDTSTGTCSDAGEFYDHFRMWRNSPNGYYDVGVHLGVSTAISGGIADGGNQGPCQNFEDDAFVSPKDAVAGLGNADFGEFQNICVQEVFHTFIDKQLSMAYPDDHQQEHDLGMVISDSRVTPMATGYSGQNGNHADHGDCRTGNTQSEHTQSPTSCTIDALESTYISEKGDWFQATKETVYDNWITENYDKDIVKPVVFSKPLTNDGDQPAHTRIRNVENNSFEHIIEEWEYLDGIHKSENVGAFVIDTGLRVMCNINTSSNPSLIEAGIREVDSDWTQVSFLHYDDSEGTPVVITKPQTDQGLNSDPITTRLRNISSSSFEVKCEEDENGDYHGPEEVAYVAFQKGIVGDLVRKDGISKYEAFVVENKFDSEWRTLSFQETYSNPVFLAEIQTLNGGNPCNLRYRSLTSDSVEIQIEEYQANDSETNHIIESVGYIVVETAP